MRKSRACNSCDFVSVQLGSFRRRLNIIMEKFLTSATMGTLLLFKQTIWEDMWKLTFEKTTHMQLLWLKWNYGGHCFFSFIPKIGQNSASLGIIPKKQLFTSSLTIFKHLIEQMQSNIRCMCVVFSNVSFHMSSQNACLNRCKVTIAAEMQNFSIIILKHLLKSPD